MTWTNEILTLLFFLTVIKVDQRVFKDFMAEKLPRLMAHLEEHNVDVSLVTFNWFLVVFVESLPSDILLKVWDAFFYEGTKVKKIHMTICSHNSHDYII